MFELDRRLIANFDWVLMVLTLLLAGAGLVNLYSASAHSAVFLRQFYWLLLGLGVFADIASYTGGYRERARVPYGETIP